MATSALAGMAPAFAAPARRKPNFIVILCDDLGYGDIEPTGGKTIPTPNINPHDALFLFDDEEVSSVRTQRWKCIQYADYHGHVISTDKKYPQLYDVAADPSECYSVHQRYPEVLAQMRQKLSDARMIFGPRKKGMPAFGAPVGLAAMPRED